MFKLQKITISKKSLSHLSQQPQDKAYMIIQKLKEDEPKTLNSSLHILQQANHCQKNKITKTKEKFHNNLILWSSFNPQSNKTIFWQFIIINHVRFRNILWKKFFHQVLQIKCIVKLVMKSILKQVKFWLNEDSITSGLTAPMGQKI